MLCSVFLGRPTNAVRFLVHLDRIMNRVKKWAAKPTSKLRHAPQKQETPMSDTTIGTDSMVFVNYVLRDSAGEEIDASPENEPLSYLHGHGQIVEGLEKALKDKGAGETVRVTIPPEEGYGNRDPDRLVRVNRSQFEFESRSVRLQKTRSQRHRRTTNSC